jgi:acetylornithine deacetylase
MISDGKCFGRGALDDKAGIAMLLMLAEVLQATDLRLPCNVYFESVIEDEDTGNGTKALTEAGLYADAALVIDGTWPFRMIDAHLGQLWLEFTISGQPVAACSCKRGINPIQIAAKLLALFNQYITDKNNGYSRDSHPHWHNIDAPYFISPGVIQAGNWPGATPETCRLVCQFGFPEPDTTTTLLADIDTLFNRLSREEHELVHGSVKGLKTNPFANRNNLLVRLLTDNIKRLRAGEMEPVNVAVTGHCDLRHLKKQNGKPADACLYGPGGGGNPHVKNEFYRLDHFVPVAQNIISTLLGWCAG